MLKIIRGNCQQIALIEAMMFSGGNMYKVEDRSENVPLWEVQTQFKPVIRLTKYELFNSNIFKFPIRVHFRFNNLDDKGDIQTNQEGIRLLKEVYPLIFTGQTEEESNKDEIDLNVKYPTKSKEE